MQGSVMWQRWLLALVLLSCGCRVVSGKQEVGERSRAAPGVLAPQDPWIAGKLPLEGSSLVPVAGGSVTLQVASDPPSLNTIVDSDWTATRITEHRVYQSLVANDPHDHPRYRVVPELAERWEVSADSRTYRFFLRRGVSWHDGRPFTSKDVLATFDKVQDPKTKAVHIRSYTKELLSYRALDDYTLEFTFSRPYFLALDGVFASVPIQPAHVLGGLTALQYNEASSNPLNRQPIGTGPYRFVLWEAGQRIVLERNHAYQGRAPWLERLVFRIVKDPAVALQLAERLELDGLSVTAEQWRKMDSPQLRSDFNRQLEYGNNYSWIGWNSARPFFASAEVRTALTLLVDRPGIIDGLLYGLARPTTCHFYWASDSCDPKLQPLPYDPAQAARLLEQAGWRDHDGDGVLDRDGVAFRFGLMIPASSPEAARMATKLKEDFGRAGVELRLQRVEWSIFTKRLRAREFDACTLAWADSGPRGDPTQIWHSSSSTGGSNYIGFANAQADELIDRARSTLQEAPRDDLYRQLGVLLHREQPYTWLYVRPRLSLINRRIHGVVESLAGWQYEDWWLSPSTNKGQQP
jgi:peptide/nickel transport system substrate-binding protein